MTPAGKPAPKPASKPVLKGTVPFESLTIEARIEILCSRLEAQHRKNEFLDAVRSRRKLGVESVMVLMCIALTLITTTHIVYLGWLSIPVSQSPLLAQSILEWRLKV